MEEDRAEVVGKAEQQENMAVKAEEAGDLDLGVG